MTMSDIRLAFCSFCAAFFLLVSADSVHAQSLLERWGINAFLGVAPSTQDFVTRVGYAELLQLELVRLAEKRGNERTRRFAAAMLSEHRDASAQLRQLVSGGAVRVAYPTTPGTAYQEKLDALANLGEAEFDSGFDKTQVALHEEMVSLFERYGSAGSHPDLRRFAYRHLPHLLEHWRRARELQ